MRAGRHTLVILASASALTGCAAPPPPPPPPKPVVVLPPTDTVRIPLTDLLTRTYYKNIGGLYPGGSNFPPADHDSAARARRNAIKPLDVNGDESPFGKYVLISIGMSRCFLRTRTLSPYQRRALPCLPSTTMKPRPRQPIRSIKHASLCSSTTTTFSAATRIKAAGISGPTT